MKLFEKIYIDIFKKKIIYTIIDKNQYSIKHIFLFHLNFSV